MTHPACVWILLRGEADLATAAELDAALRTVRLARRSVHLHLGGLGFADVSTLCQLAMFARRAREAGHSVMTCGADPMIRKVAALLGIRDELGVLPDSSSLPVSP